MSLQTILYLFIAFTALPIAVDGAKNKSFAHYQKKLDAMLPIEVPNVKRGRFDENIELRNISITSLDIGEPIGVTERIKNKPTLKMSMKCVKVTIEGRYTVWSTVVFWNVHVNGAFKIKMHDVSARIVGVLSPFDSTIIFADDALTKVQIDGLAIEVHIDAHFIIRPLISITESTINVILSSKHNELADMSQKAIAYELKQRSPIAYEA